MIYRIIINDINKCALNAGAIHELPLQNLQGIDAGIKVVYYRKDRFRSLNT